MHNFTTVFESSIQIKHAQMHLMFATVTLLETNLEKTRFEQLWKAFNVVCAERVHDVGYMRACATGHARELGCPPTTRDRHTNTRHGSSYLVQYPENRINGYLELSADESNLPICTNGSHTQQA